LEITINLTISKAIIINHYIIPGIIVKMIFLLIIYNGKINLIMEKILKCIRRYYRILLLKIPLKQDKIQNIKSKRSFIMIKIRNKKRNK
jgi:hypothetical protein